MKKRFLSLLLVLAMALSLLPATALAADDSVTITFTAVSATEIYTPRGEMTVHAGTAAQYGYQNGAGVGANEVTILDAIVQAHVDKYGAAFTETYTAGREAYLKMSGSMMTRAFGGSASYSAQLVNGGTLGSAAADTAVLKDGDVVENLYATDDNTVMGCDLYTYFALNNTQVNELTVQAGETLELTLMGCTAFSKVWPDWYGPWNPEALEDLDSEETADLYPVDSTGSLGTVIEDAIADDGTVTIPALIAGDYSFTVMGYESMGFFPLIMPSLTVHVVNSGEDFTAANAKANLSWENIRGDNLRMDAVTSNLVLPATFAGADAAWSCTDTTGALTPYGSYGYAYVDRPASEDASCTLTASLSYNDGASVTKSFNIIVKAEGVDVDKTAVTSYAGVMEGIGVNYADENDQLDVNWSPIVTSPISDNDLAWAVIDMAAYGDVLGTPEMARYSAALDSNGTAAKFLLAQAALGIDISAPAAAGANIWSAPSILLARYAAGTTDAADADNAELIAIMLNYLGGTYESYGYPVALDVDTVAMVLPALALFKTETGVQDAIDVAVTWLLTQQNTDGTFSSYGVSNAESTAAVVVALSALGIDPHTDARFIKNYNSAVEGLLTFALADNSGFGHKGNVTYNAMSTEQGFRALVAYARFKDSAAAYNIFTDANNSSDTDPVPAPSISVINPPAPDDSSGSDDITVYFTLRGDSLHGSGAHAGYETWISRTPVTVSEGTSVGGVFTRVLTQNGYTAVGASSGYVSSITTPAGLALSEGSNGENSGWMYSVNGEDATVGLNDYILSSGDSVIWFYEDDYTTRGTVDMEPEPDKPADPAELPFGDVEGHWALEAIRFVHDKGLMQGDGESFDPEGTLSRAMLITILYRLAGEPDVKGDKAFDDVPEGQWYAKAVAWAAENGIVSGAGDGLFAPSDEITREQMAKILFAYANYKKYAADSAADLNGYTDADSISDWALAAIKWANAEGLITGRTDKTIEPDGDTTRAETAEILMRFVEFISKCGEQG